MGRKPGPKKATRARWGTVRRQRSGNFTASYMHGGIAGVLPAVEYRATQTFESEGDARVWLARERRLIDTGDWTPPADREAARRAAERAEAAAALTLREYATRWLAEADHRPTTRVRYASLLAYYICGEPLPPKGPKGKPMRLAAVGLGDVPVTSLTRTQVASWWRGLPLKTRRASCDQAYALLRAICNAAVDEEVLSQSPVRVKGAGKPSAHRSIEPLTPAQVEAVADAMPPRWRLGVLLGAWTALRVGEVRELRRRDVDLTKGTITVSRGVSSGIGDLVVGAPKTAAGRRVVAVPAPVLTDLRSHVRDHAQLGPDGLLFWDAASGQQVSYPRWRAAFTKACAAAGVEGVRFHDLRHVGLTYAATAGATTRELQAMAGHTTAAMAMRYQAVAADHMAEVVAGLGALITSGRTPK